MKKASYLLFTILFSVLLSSCAAHKAKKCDCPTFGDNHRHAHIEKKPAEKDI